MRSFIVYISLLLFTLPLFGQSHENELATLKNYIDQKSSYDIGKQNRIAQLKTQLDKTVSFDLNTRFYLCSKLYEEYKSFNYNLAFKYAHQLQQLSFIIKDPTKIAYAKIKMGFILLSSGMFKETFDTLRSIRLSGLPDPLKKEYYLLTARTYYDLVDFDKDEYYTDIYNRKVRQYIDSAIRLCQPNSFEYIYYNGLKNIRSGDLKKATQNLRTLVDRYHLSVHQYAIVTSTLSDIYVRSNRPDSAASLLIEAAIADIKSSTKEAAAMLNLAQLLHKQGNNSDAYLFIKQAMDDAMYYGARQRKIQVSAILPVIAGARILAEQEQKRALLFYSSLLTLFAIVTIVFVVIISRQLKRNKAADKLVMEANLNLKQTIEKLNEAEKFKNNLVSILAHDFRSPLCSTISIARMMRNSHGLQEDELELFYADIEKDATKMLESFDVILQWIRQQLSGYEFKAETLKFYDLFCESAALFQQQLEAKKITFSNKIPIDMTITSDKEMLQFVNRNLLSNAIKFSPEGGMIVVAGRIEGEEFMISVADDGPGLNAAVLGKLFAISSQSGNSTQTGAGIALSICRDFIKKLNGRIWAENKEPNGAVFCYTLPKQ